MEKTLRDFLSRTLAAYEHSSGVTPTTVCQRALNDNTFYERVVTGGSGFTIKTYDRVMVWLAVNWPAEAAWPADVPRPEEDGAAPACSPAAVCQPRNKIATHLNAPQT